jgi:hypothetical protein
LYGMPGRSKVNRRDGTRTLTCDNGRMPRTPRNVSLQRFEPYARYSTVLSFSCVTEGCDDTSVFASKGVSFREASRRSCDGCGTGEKTRFGASPDRREVFKRLASFVQIGSGASGEPLVMVVVIVRPNCVMAADSSINHRCLHKPQHLLPTVVESICTCRSSDEL